MLTQRLAFVVCCASELLRLDNYLLQPTIDNVRVLAGLAASLRVQANPAASWSLLGADAAAYSGYDTNADHDLRNGHPRSTIHRHTLRAATNQGLHRH
jgi:hypothetical protein